MGRLRGLSLWEQLSLMPMRRTVVPLATHGDRGRQHVGRDFGKVNSIACHPIWSSLENTSQFCCLTAHTMPITWACPAYAGEKTQDERGSCFEEQLLRDGLHL